MNTNMMEMNLNEMAAINGGDALDHAAGAVTGTTVGLMVGSGVGSIAGAPGVVIGMGVGAIAGGISCGILGINKVKSWLRSKLGTKK